jgi:hypothetical protein
MGADRDPNHLFGCFRDKFALVLADLAEGADSQIVSP